MERKRISLAAALATVPGEVASDDDDFGRTAKRARLDADTEALRTRIDMAAEDAHATAAARQQLPVGIREGEAVVRIPDVVARNEQEGMLRADGRPWTIQDLERRRTQPYQPAWLAAQAAQLDAVAKNRTMRFVNLLAKLMNRRPQTFYSPEGIAAIQASERAARVYAERRDIERKAVDAPAKERQLAALEQQLAKLDAELDTLALPAMDANVPVPPYSAGTEVTRSLMDPDVDRVPILHAWPRERRDDPAVEMREETYASSFDERLHSLFALVYRVRVMELAVRVAEPNNPHALHENRATAALSKEDRDAAVEYISTQWHQRYDATELGKKSDAGIRELFLATWAYDMLRNTLGGAPMDLALATWHGATAISLYANYLLFRGILALSDAEERDLAGKLQAQARAAVVEAGEPPAYVATEAWTTLLNAFEQLRGAIASAAFSGDPLQPRMLSEVDALLEDARYLRSAEALATTWRRPLPPDAAPENAYAPRDERRAALLEEYKLLSQYVPEHALDLDALAVMHRVTRDASIRPGRGARGGALLWTAPPLQAAFADRVALYVEQLDRAPLPESPWLVQQFAALGRNIVLVQTRNDVPALRAIARAFGWVDLRTMQATLRLAEVVVRILARVHVAYLAARGAVAPAEQWRTLDQQPVRAAPGSADAILQQFVHYLMTAVLFLPSDLEAMAKDLQARILAATEEGLLPTDAFRAHLPFIRTALPVALVYGLAVAQNARDERRRGELRSLRAALVRDAGEARRILAEIAAEAPPGAARAGVVAPTTYTQTLEWVQQPFVGGMAVLSETTLGALDEGKAAVQRWVPSLRAVPLEVLTEDFESGLAVAFAKLVAILDAQSELLHERDYVRGEMYREVPKRFHDAIKGLKRFTATRGAGGRWYVRDTESGAQSEDARHRDDALASTDVYTIY